MTVNELRAHLQHPPKSVYGFLVAVALIAAAVYRGGTASELTSRLETARADSEKAARQIKVSGGLEDQIAELDAALTRAGERLVNPDNRGESLKYFYRVAQESGVTLVSIAPLPLMPGAEFRVAPFQATVSGTFQNALKFVRKIERGTYFFAPREYRIQSGDVPGEETSSVTSSGDRVTLSMTFEFLAPK